VEESVDVWELTNDNRVVLEILIDIASLVVQFRRREAPLRRIRCAQSDIPRDSRSEE